MNSFMTIIILLSYITVQHNYTVSCSNPYYRFNYHIALSRQYKNFL